MQTKLDRPPAARVEHCKVRNAPSIIANQCDRPSDTLGICIKQTLACCQMEIDRKAVAVAEDVDFGRKTLAKAA